MKWTMDRPQRRMTNWTEQKRKEINWTRMEIKVINSALARMEKRYIASVVVIVVHFLGGEGGGRGEVAY